MCIFTVINTKFYLYIHILLNFLCVKGILVEPLDPVKQMNANLGKILDNPKSDKVDYPKNYATLYDFFARSFSVIALFGM